MANIINTVYCHFSFKRPKGREYGLFAIAFYSDFEGKKLIVSKTRKYKLWEDHQFIAGIQSYEHALQSIYEYQGQMMSAGIRQVMLVTDNSILAGWIENHKKNMGYYKYMEKAVSNYRVGGAKEIVIGVGLCEPRKAEKSYKYCTEDRVCNNYKASVVSSGDNKIQVKEYKSALDIINEDISEPEIEGIEEV